MTVGGLDGWMVDWVLWQASIECDSWIFPISWFYQLSSQRSLPEIYNKKLNLLGSCNLFWRMGKKGFQLELSFFFFFFAAGACQAISEDNLICAFLLLLPLSILSWFCRLPGCKTECVLWLVHKALGHREGSLPWLFHWLLDDLGLVSQPLLHFFPTL